MKQLLFLSLKTFSFTGGIEKFNRCFLKALEELYTSCGWGVYAISAYDDLPDEKYFPKNKFRGHSGNRMRFSLHALYKSVHTDILVLGHINLAILGYLMKKFRPSVKIILIAHGIEVWKKQRGIKLKFLEQTDWIFSVSNFTGEQLLQSNPSVAPSKVKVFPNAIDPFFSLPVNFEKPHYLMKRYQLEPHDKVLMTITRLFESEKYKGFDQTIRALAELGKLNINLKYLICGKAESNELRRVQTLIENQGLSDKVLLTGFIKEEELSDHYLLADVFVMPSKKEGFGIVFIEALAHGCKVIAGSKDGSVEALQQGAFGELINPDSIEELKQAITKSLMYQNEDAMALQKMVVAAFSFSQYKERLRDYLTAI